MKNKKIMIVIEETGEDEGHAFNVYLDGDKERVYSISEKDMSPAEWWAIHLFQLCMDELEQNGALKSVETTDKGRIH